MEHGAAFALAMYAIMGVMFVGLSIPLLLDKVPPNGWYGFRTRLTLGDSLGDSEADGDNEADGLKLGLSLMLTPSAGSIHNMPA